MMGRAPIASAWSRMAWLIGLVGDEVAGGEAGDQRQGIGGVIGLAAGEQETDRPTEAVECDVPLAGPSASGTPQSLVLAPPLG